MALDVARVLQREPAAVQMVMDELLVAAGDDQHLRRAHARLEAMLQEPKLLDARGRTLVEALAVLAAATILRAHAPAAVADAFIATRISGDPRQTYGQGLEHADVRAIIARASPNRGVSVRVNSQEETPPRRARSAISPLKASNAVWVAISASQGAPPVRRRYGPMSWRHASSSSLRSGGMRGASRRSPLCAASHAYAACQTSSGRRHVVAPLELGDGQHAGFARVRPDFERRHVLALAADGEQPAAVVGQPLGILVGAVLHGARLGENLRAVEQRHERQPAHLPARQPRIGEHAGAELQREAHAVEPALGGAQRGVEGDLRPPRHDDETMGARLRGA